MSDNSASVVPAQLKPFKKGDDSRRNRNGSISGERAAWAARFNNALAAKLDPEEAAKVLVEAYKAKRPWAVSEVHERLMGKVTQVVEADQAITYRIVYDDNKADEDPA